MKKRLLFRYGFSFLILFVLGDCKKKGTTPPVITLQGSNPMIISLQGIATDPGATAQDNQDGNITSKIISSWSSTPPNVNQKGHYIITYTVSDAAGYTTTAARAVNVVNDADFLNGIYNSDDTCAVSTVFPYIDTIITSTTINKQFAIHNFRGIGKSVTANLNGTALGSYFSWQTQQLGSDTLSAATNTGSISNLTPVTFSFVYLWSNGGSTTESCTGMYIHQ
jgi:hypothetical protein